MTRAQKNTVLQYAVSAILVSGTATVMLAHRIPLIRKISEYSVHITLAMLVLAMLFLVIRRQKMMFAALGCTAALCIFLKTASNTSLKLAQVNEKAKLKVSHINLGNINFNISSTDDFLLDQDVDIVSLQELTPDWSTYLDELLREEFPYRIQQVRIDPYGMAVYSRIPFEKADTFLCQDIPNFNILVNKKDNLFRLVTSYLTPAFDRIGLEKATSQLETIAKNIQESKEPIIALGEYNMVYWTNEIRNFQSTTELENSRRDLVQGNLRVPYDHIFFSSQLECTQFIEVKDGEQNYIGLTGTYQLKDLSEFKTMNSKLNE